MTCPYPECPNPPSEQSPPPRGGLCASGSLRLSVEFGLELGLPEVDEAVGGIADLMEIDEAREAGEISEQEAAEAEDILLERLIAIRG